MEGFTIIFICFLFFWSFEYFIDMVEDYDTNMLVRREELKLRKEYDEAYGFRKRVDHVNFCNNIGQLDFTQFRGRL